MNELSEVWENEMAPSYISAAVSLIYANAMKPNLARIDRQLRTAANDSADCPSLIETNILREETYRSTNSAEHQGTRRQNYFKIIFNRLALAIINDVRNLGEHRRCNTRTIRRGLNESFDR